MHDRISRVSRSKQDLETGPDVSRRVCQLSIFGWEALRFSGTYTKNANRFQLAGETMHLLFPANDAS